MKLKFIGTSDYYFPDMANADWEGGDESEIQKRLLTGLWVEDKPVVETTVVEKPTATPPQPTVKPVVPAIPVTTDKGVEDNGNRE
ncbi:MAG: hypothetical protein HXX08_11400 [Chloroflexi bacterium]|uniref:Uncharacterized protein n=1 Tax=Candidatus Chlorohelix allophototropha TaxID=3003348 RepID=A0A8T7M3N4_9CHLR|nr:hypothetical protein [Chloroflexota bacterium]WJW65843.1 hypothetical protein OZ401_001622 [Chloroflexota bacterium L227-S17]